MEAGAPGNVEELKARLRAEFALLAENFQACGIVERSGVVFPLSTDSKVLSTIFEIMVKGKVHEIAREFGFKVKEPETQNCYPDYTLHRGKDDRQKIALDVKTTYRKTTQTPFSYTLGSYTSFIRPGRETKSIAYPFSHYACHIVAGFVYERNKTANTDGRHSYDISELNEIDPPITGVKSFVQDKWRIASDKPGSGNTANIGSIKAHLEDFEEGTPLFASEGEFLEYWREYQRDKRHPDHYATLEDFRARRGLRVCTASAPSRSSAQAFLAL